jgi:alpha-beta hydrolase superfamily lysophospholipase
VGGNLVRRWTRPIGRSTGPVRTACLVAAVLLSAGLVASCSSTTTTRITPAPAGLPSFYSVPSPLPAQSAGTIVKYEKISATGLHGTVYRVMYVSESETGAPLAVTGLVAVPSSPPPRGGYPVVTWGHGTNGMADQCAPSLDPTTSVPLANVLLDHGWEVVASDYQGEGTPGLMPYIAGVSAARNTIDMVRAARNLALAHASSDYVVWGHSEGGQTALFALHIAATYAPELHLKGVVAGAPPSQFKYLYQFLLTSPFRYYLYMVAAGWNTAYGSQTAPMSQVLTSKAMSLLPVLSQGCSDHVAAVIDKYPLPQIVKVDPFTVPKWRSLITANDPDSFSTPSSAPLLIIQGGKDEQIPVVTTKLLANHYCQIGQTLQRWLYPGQSHAGVIVPSIQDMAHWIADRFAGDPTPDPYQPIGLSGIEATSCSGGSGSALNAAL